jgi:hypothetical protein
VQNTDSADPGRDDSARQETDRRLPSQPTGVENICIQSPDGREGSRQTRPETGNGTYAEQKSPLENSTERSGCRLTQDEQRRDRCAQLEGQLRQQDNAHEKALEEKDEMIRKLHDQVREMTSKYEADSRRWKSFHHHQQQILQQRLESDIARQGENHKREVVGLKGERMAMEERYKKELFEKEEYQNKLKKQKEEEYQNKLKKQKEEAEQKFKDFHKHVISAADDFQPKPDSHFRQQFETLQMKVQVLAEKAMCERHVDKETLGASFNQISFVQAVKDKHLNLVLEKAFWTILYENIFLTPFRVFGEHGDSLFITWCKFSNGAYMSRHSA